MNIIKFSKGNKAFYYTFCNNFYNILDQTSSHLTQSLK